MSRKKQKGIIDTSEGEKIAYHYFPAQIKDISSDTFVVVLFYRKNDFCCEISSFLSELNLLGYAFFALDLDQYESQCDNLDKLSDILYQVYLFKKFIVHLGGKYQVRQSNIAIVFHEEWAVIVSVWIIDYAPDIRSVVFYSPCFFFSKWDIYSFILKKISRKKIFMPDKDYTLKDNALFSAAISRRRLTGLLYIGKRFIWSILTYATLTQFIVTPVDLEVRRTAILRFYANIASSIKELYLMLDAASGWMDEIEGHIIINQVRLFLIKHFSQVTIPVLLFNSHIKGVTFDKYEQLSLPEKNILKNIYWSINRYFLKHIGKFSSGIRLGLEAGFDSGASLDYIYENKLDGSNQFAKMIERYYLNNVGWHCTQQIKKHVEELILLACSMLYQARKQVKLLYIAAGQGRYIINILAKIRQPITHVLMRDFAASNIGYGYQLIEENKLTSIVSFEQGNACALDDLATLPKDRMLIIVSGFYKLFSDNQLVLTWLNSIAMGDILFIPANSAIPDWPIWLVFLQIIN